MSPVRMFAEKSIQATIGKYDELLNLVKKWSQRWFGHVSRSSGLVKTILQGTVKGKVIEHYIHSEEFAERSKQPLENMMKLPWSRDKTEGGFGHVSRSSGLAKTILQGTVNGKGRGRQKRMEDNNKEWTGRDGTLPSQLGQLKKGQDEKGLLQSSVVPRARL